MFLRVHIWGSLFVLLLSVFFFFADLIHSRELADCRFALNVWDVWLHVEKMMRFGESRYFIPRPHILLAFFYVIGD